MEDQFLDPEFEALLRDFVLKTLGDSPQGFNGPHTLAAVYWMKWLLARANSPERSLAKVLLTAIYCHDIGWSRISEEKLATYGNMEAQKRDHMRLGAEMTRQFLEPLVGRFLTHDELTEIVDLVFLHDLVEMIRGSYNRALALVAMADTLGQIDVARVRPTLKPSEVDHFLERLEARRRPILDACCLAEYERLVREFRSFYNFDTPEKESLPDSAALFYGD